MQQVTVNLNRLYKPQGSRPSTVFPVLLKSVFYYEITTFEAIPSGRLGKIGNDSQSEQEKWQTEKSFLSLLDSGPQIQESNTLG